MKNEFPVYYIDTQSQYMYKIDDVKFIDIKTNTITYKRTVVKTGFENPYIKENWLFTLTTEVEEIPEALFNEKYSDTKAYLQGDHFPKYFYCPVSYNYIKVLKIGIGSWNNKDAYIGPMVNPKYGEFFVTTKISLASVEKGIWVPSTKEEYENAFNKVLNKIK